MIFIWLALTMLTTNNQSVTRCFWDFYHGL